MPLASGIAGRIFELKVDEPVDKAFAQIRGKGYAEPYLASGRPVWAIGLSFDHARIRNRAQCAHCMACVQFCPRQAMTIRGRRVRPEFQYHHPGVTAADLFV